MDVEERRENHGEGVEKGARKRLVVADGSLNIRGQKLSHLAGKVAGTVMLIEGASSSAPSNAAASTPEKVHIVKKRRQEGEEGEELELINKAASLEEGRQA